ncbi:MAG: hypothetical protein ABIT10_00600 [Alteraurantiacibacter sp.]
MLTFGFTTLVDLLSWSISLALGAKVLATLILLSVDRRRFDRPGWGSVLWWITKLTPLPAVACFWGIARLQNDTMLMNLALGLALFVIVAVPLKVIQRNRRISRQDDRLGAG